MVVTTGFFDGVHLGHRLVLDALVKCARQRGDKSTVVTFWPHPRNVLQQDAEDLRLLSSMDEKKRMILDSGVDCVEVLEFSRDFSRLGAEAYLRDYVKGRFGGTALLLGYDNRIGCDSLSPEETAAVARKVGLDVVMADMVMNENVTVSSSRIRESLGSGQVEEAASMLGYNYSLHGVVVSGNRIGRTIGYPTANMQLYEPLKLVPANGAYLVDVDTCGGHFRGMTNIGVRPTVGNGASKTIETNIFDFDEQIYGLDIRISFLRRLRDERKFSSLDELQCQLSLDREMCMRYK